MRILTSSYTLDRAGVPTYTYALVRGLQSRGHDVTVYSPHGGYFEKLMPTVRTLDPAQQYDIIVAQHTNCAYDLRAAYPTTPFVFAAHGVLPEIEQTPVGIQIDRWTAINRQVTNHLVDCGVPKDRIDLVRDFVDESVFMPQTPVRPDTPRVLFISNYKKWRNYRILSEACAALNLPFKAVGAPYGRSRDLVADINDADIVVSWGRGILEGMSCGRCVISFDKTHGDGYLDAATYFKSRETNFSHFFEGDTRYDFTTEIMIQELQRYDPTHSITNRHLIEQHHSLKHGIDCVMENITRTRAAYS